MSKSKKDIVKLEANETLLSMGLQQLKIQQRLLEGVSKAIEFHIGIVEEDREMLADRVKSAEFLVSRVLPVRSEVQGSGLPEIEFNAERFLSDIDELTM